MSENYIKKLKELHALNRETTKEDFEYFARDEYLMYSIPNDCMLMLVTQTLVFSKNYLIFSENICIHHVFGWECVTTPALKAFLRDNQIILIGKI